MIKNEIKVIALLKNIMAIKLIIGQVAIKDNGVEMSLGGYTGKAETNNQGKTEQIASTIKSKGSLNTASGADTVVMGSNLEGKTVDMYARGDMTVMSATELNDLLNEAKNLEITLKTRVGNQYVDLVSQICDAGKAVDSAVNSNSGETKASDLAKTAKALQAAVAVARAVKAVNAAAETAASTPVLGFYAETKLERTESMFTTETTNQNTKKSSITATGGDVNLSTDQKLLVMGSDLKSDGGDIITRGKTNVTITSAEELNSLTQSTGQNSQSLSMGTRGASVQIGNSNSGTTGSGVSNTNSTISAQNGTFKVITDGDLNYTGANGLAKKVDLAEVKGDINIESKSDSQTQSTNDQSVSIGKSNSFGINQSSSTETSIGNRTTLIGTEQVDVGGKNLTIKGATLANAEIVTDSTTGETKLQDKGNMNIISEKVTVTDINTKTEQKSEGYGVGVNISNNPLSPDSANGNVVDAKNLTETNTFGTLGSYKKADGTAVAANRDINDNQKITKTEKYDNGAALDVDTEMVTNTAQYIKNTVDSTVNLPKNAVTITQRVTDDGSDIKDAVVAGVTKGVNPLKDYENSYEFKQATVAFQKDNPELTKILNNTEKKDSAEYQQALQTYTNYVQKKMDTTETKANLYDSNQLVNKETTDGTSKDGLGMADKDKKDVFINIGKVDMTNQNQLLGTTGHEIIHSTGEHSETVAERGAEQAQNAWNRENGFNGNITGGGYVNGGEFYQENKTNFVVINGNNMVNNVQNADPRTYIINGINNDKNNQNILFPQAPEAIKDFAQAVNERLGYNEVRTVPGIYYKGQVHDVLDVVSEMINVDQYSDKTTAYIKQDLIDNPLKPGEKLNLIGYSGGGQIAFNVADKLKGKNKVDNLITLASPVFELTRNNVDKVTYFNSWEDKISWPSVLDIRANHKFYLDVKHSGNNSWLNNDSVVNEVSRELK